MTCMHVVRILSLQDPMKTQDPDMFDKAVTFIFIYSIGWQIVFWVGCQPYIASFRSDEVPSTNEMGDVSKMADVSPKSILEFAPNFKFDYQPYINGDRTVTMTGMVETTKTNVTTDLQQWKGPPLTVSEIGGGDILLQESAPGTIITMGDYNGHALSSSCNENDLLTPTNHKRGDISPTTIGQSEIRLVRRSPCNRVRVMCKTVFLNPPMMGIVLGFIIALVNM